MHWPPAATRAIPGSRAHTSLLIPINGHTHAHAHNVCWKDRLKFPQTADVNVTLAMLTWVWNSKQLVTKHPVSCQQHKAGQASTALTPALSTCIVNIASLNSIPCLTIPWSTVLKTTVHWLVSIGILQSRHTALSSVSLQCLQSCLTAATGLENNILSAWSGHGWVNTIPWLIPCQQF